MTPCDLNVLVAGISNYLYATLSPEEFRCLSLFLNELSKSMFTMSIYQSICVREKKEEEIEKNPKERAEQGDD